MRRGNWWTIGAACVLVWAADDAFGRGGRGGGAFRGTGGQSRPAATGRTPSYSRQAERPREAVGRPTTPSGGEAFRPSTRPSDGAGLGSQVGSRPTVDGRPGLEPRPGLESGRPSDIAGVGAPGVGARPPAAGTRPFSRPVGAVNRPLNPNTRDAARPEVVDRRDLQTGVLPGLGDARPAADRISDGDRRNQLQDRLSGRERLRDGDRTRDRDFDQTRQDWRDYRDNVRNDWQNYRDDARNDWQRWRHVHNPWHNDWYWGYASGYWRWWDPTWDDYAVAAAAGLTWWDVNRWGYAFGCGDVYVNPYYSDSAGYNYSQPIVEVSAQVAVESQQPAGPPEQVLDVFTQARNAFYEGNYAQALELVNQSAAQTPTDPMIHEFRSLVLFALKRYGDSAAAIHAVLAVGPGWDWKTLSSLYPDVETYTVQLRALEQYQRENPASAGAHFLLGYHYLTCGSIDAALDQFRQASQLQPSDAIAADLVRTLSPRDTPSRTTAQPQTNAKPANPSELVGVWSAGGKDGSTFTMKLDQDGKFDWTFTDGKQTHSVKGVYAVEGNVLAMEPDSGGVLLAELIKQTPSSFHFQMIGANPSDPGLDFSRSR